MVRISEDRRFEFGKYEGLTINEVIEKDLQYVEYLMNSKIHWLFNDYEKQKVRNKRHSLNNKDINSVNVKGRTPFEEEMYRILREC